MRLRYKVKDANCMTTGAAISLGGAVAIMSLATKDSFCFAIYREPEAVLGPKLLTAFATNRSAILPPSILPSFHPSIHSKPSR